MRTVAGAVLVLALAAGTALAVPDKTVTIKPSGTSEKAGKSKTPDEPVPVKTSAGAESATTAAEPAFEPGAVPPGYEAAARALKLSRVTLYRVQGRPVGVTDDGCYLLLTDEYLKVDGQKGASSLAVLVAAADGAVKRVLLLKSPDDAACVRLVMPQLGFLEKQTVTTGEEARPSLVIPGAVATSTGIQKTVNGTLELFKPVFRRLAIQDGVPAYDGAPLNPETAKAPEPPPVKDAPPAK